MAGLTDASLKVLKALAAHVQAHAAGREDELTLPAVDLARAVDPAARGPLRNEAAVREALDWCAKHDLPALPLITVIDKNFPQPESRTMVLAFGALDRTAARDRWQAELARIEAMSPRDVAELGEALAAEEAALAPKPAPRKPRATGGAKAAGGASRAKAAGGAAAATGAAGASRATSRASKQAVPAPSRSSVRTRMVSIDPAAYRQALEAYAQLVAEMAPGEDLWSNSFAAQEEGDAQALWQEWHDQLAPQSWTIEMVGSGLILEAVQATADDERARWIVRSDGPRNLAAQVKRPPHARDGVALFEGATLRFFADEMQPKEFLETMRELLGRAYALSTHLLFLADDNAYVPVTPRAAEEGLRRLGVEQMLSGACTWEGYARFLEHLDRMRDLAVEAGHARPTRCQANALLNLLGAGYLD